VEIEILKWDTYQPRKDRLNYSWFRFENKFFESADIYDLTLRQKLVYVFLLCEASKKGGKTFRTTPNYVGAMLKIKQNELVNDLKALSGVGVIRTRDDGIETPTEQNRTIQNKESKDSSSTEPKENLGSEGQGCLIIFESVRKIISGKVTLNVQNGWLNLYKDVEYICQELISAQIWIDSNTHKAPKSQFSRFFSAWLKRGWERHRKSISSNPQGSGGDPFALINPKNTQNSKKAVR